MAMCEHPGYRDQDLPKSGYLCSPLRLQNSRLSVIHLVMDDAQKLRRGVNRVRTPSMVQTTISILVVKMSGLVVHKYGPLFAAPWIFGYAILKKVALGIP